MIKVIVVWTLLTRGVFAKVDGLEMIVLKKSAMEMGFSSKSKIKRLNVSVFQAILVLIVMKKTAYLIAALMENAIRMEFVSVFLDLKERSFVFFLKENYCLKFIVL